MTENRQPLKFRCLPQRLLVKSVFSLLGTRVAVSFLTTAKPLLRDSSVRKRFSKHSPVTGLPSQFPPCLSINIL